MGFIPGDAKPWNLAGIFPKTPFTPHSEPDIISVFACAKAAQTPETGVMEVLKSTGFSEMVDALGESVPDPDSEMGVEMDGEVSEDDLGSRCVEIYI